MGATRVTIRGALPAALKLGAVVFLVAALFGNAGGQTHKKSAAGAAPEFQGIYTGTIGDKAIVMEIGASTLKAGEPPHTEDGKRYPIEGRYFYRRERIGIRLEGEVIAHGKLRLREYPGGMRSAAEWRIGFRGEAGSGSFCECDAASAAADHGGLKIALTRVSKAFDGDFSWIEDTPDQAYYDLLLDSPPTIGPEVRETDEIAYVMRSDAQLRVGMPRITRFPDPAVMKKVNDDLDELFRRIRAESGDIYFEGGERQQRGGIEYFSRDFMTLGVGQSTLFSSGFHYAYDFFAVIYNMQTGERFDMNDFFIPPEKVRGAPEEREDSIANPLELTLAELYLKYKSDHSESCDEETIRRNAGLIQPYFDRKGLALQADDVRVCGNAVIVPWDAIRDLVRKDSMFQKVLDGKNLTPDPGRRD